MKHTIGKLGAVLMVALLLSLSPASALAPVNDRQVSIVSTSHTRPADDVLKHLIGTLALVGLGAAVVLTYNTPNIIGGPTLGSTVAPTAAQAAGINLLAVTVSAADADTTITIVHNYGLSAADLAAQYPFMTQPILLTPGTAVPVFSGYSALANTLTITKANAAGSGGTYLVYVPRPHTLWR